MKQRFSVREYYTDIVDSLVRRSVSKETTSLVEMIYEGYKSGRMIFFMGNGGSASNASHMAADIGKNIAGPDQKRFRTVSLGDNSAMLTAVANDLGYENVFLEPLKSLAQEGDLILAISASGNSPNLLKAMEWAKANKLRTAAMTGFDGGALQKMVEICVHVDSWNYGVVESIHACIQHAVIEDLKSRLKNER